MGVDDGVASSDARFLLLCLKLLRQGVVSLSWLPFGLVWQPGLLVSGPREFPDHPPARFSVARAEASRIAVKCARFALSCLAIAALAGISAQAHAAATVYYINNGPQSNCSDSGSHTRTQPWCTFGPANKIRTFLPGDQILLARGSSWNQELSLTGHGTAEEPITLGAYGQGPDPKILRSQAIGDICILLTDVSHWDISNLEVGRASVGILLHYTDLFNNGIDIRNIYAHDNKGIWAGFSTQYPVQHHVVDPFAASLNINLSSGILFNIASYLKYTSSQYVLKDVTVSDIRGRNNVDSVAFDAENDTVDKRDGHNAFQDIQLSGLFLSNDNGHSAKVYQEAGLGCSDGLRLIGMTDVTVMNSVLYEEAGCRTETGTAAVILGRVCHVEIVNNIIYGVPSSGSPDETGIDLEWSEDQVSLIGNLFESNAGAGLEILNIHDEDHTTAINFDSNTFAQNASSRQPGASSIWEDNKGRGYAVPQGTVRDNIYFESHGKFFEGRSVASVTNLHNAQTWKIADYAAEEFSSIQGKNQWRYMFEPAESTWKNMRKFSATDFNGAWEASPSEYISAFTMSPGSCKDDDSCAAGAVARVWVAPQRGTVRIRGRVLALDRGIASGVTAVINLVSGKNVTQLWPAPDGPQQIAAADQEGYATNVDEVRVVPGEMIRFEVHSNGNGPNNAVSWTPSVGYIDVSQTRSVESRTIARTQTRRKARSVEVASSNVRHRSPTKVRYEVPRAPASRSTQ